ncbi:MAG: signal peptidase I [Verrucomicrobiota bacterium]
MTKLLSRRHGVIGFVLLLVFLLLLVFIAFQQGWLVAFHMKDSQAMWPTINTDDLVIAETVTNRFSEPKPGQMVIFDSKGISGLEELHGEDPPWLYVQRLVAVPGNQIQISSGELHVDNIIWEPVEWDGQIEPGPFLLESVLTEVPQDCFFVIADHYSVGEDSRYWGWVPQENLVARVLWVFRANE